MRTFHPNDLLTKYSNKSIWKQYRVIRRSLSAKEINHSSNVLRRGFSAYSRQTNALGCMVWEVVSVTMTFYMVVLSAAQEGQHDFFFAH